MERCYTKITKKNQKDHKINEFTFGTAGDCVAKHGRADLNNASSSESSRFVINGMLLY